MKALALLVAMACGASPAVVKGDRLVFHFVASEFANLTFQLDALANLSGADTEAYRTLWRRDLHWSGEDDRQIDRWKNIRVQHKGTGPSGRNAPPVAWPPNYAGFYGQELSLDQNVRIAGFQAKSLKDYRRRLEKLLDQRESDTLVSVIQHFGPRFGEFWIREGRALTEPKAAGFAQLTKDRGILQLAEQLVTFTSAQLPKHHGVWFYLIAHPTRFGRNTMATQMQSHAPVELLDDERPADKLGVIVHELVHHFYDRASLASHLQLMDEFRAQEPKWRMSAYSYLNEAVATAAGILVERRLRSDADFVTWSANPNNLYGQPWIAALGAATYPLVERCLERTGCSLFQNFAGPYIEAARIALGARVTHPHFRLASRILLVDNRALRPASRLFRDRVPSIMHATGWEQLARFPEVPVVLLALDGEQEKMLERLGPGHDVTLLVGPTAEAVEQAVERFAGRPF
jgi:hypothetical protein